MARAQGARSPFFLFFVFPSSSLLLRCQSRCIEFTKPGGQTKNLGWPGCFKRSKFKTIKLGARSRLPLLVCLLHVSIRFPSFFYCPLHVSIRFRFFFFFFPYFSSSLLLFLNPGVRGKYEPLKFLTLINKNKRGARRALQRVGRLIRELPFDSF